jgi:hypothetical protein
LELSVDLIVPALSKPFGVAFLLFDDVQLIKVERESSVIKISKREFFI